MVPFLAETVLVFWFGLVVLFVAGMSIGINGGGSVKRENKETYFVPVDLAATRDY